MAYQSTAEDLLKEIRDNRENARRANQHNLAEMKTDLLMVMGDQWDDEAKQDRKDSTRPMLTFNVLDTHCEQLVGQRRQNRRGPKLTPMDDQAEQTASIREDLIRQIDYQSHATQADDMAFTYAVKCGLGGIRINSRYEEPDDLENDNQELYIEPIHDPLAWTIDPKSRKIDASDAKWQLLEKTITRDEFKRDYPGKEVVSADFGTYAGWIDENSIRIAEYWCKEDVEGKGERKKTRVRMYLVNGKEILSTHDWPGKWIPLIPTYGKEVYIEGRRHLQSAHRHSRDSQKFLNYAKTSEAEILASASRAPWIGYKGQFNEQWLKANRTNLAYLEVEVKTAPDGRPFPFPERNQTEPPIQAYEIAAQSANANIQATFGQFDPSLGKNKSDQSGVAINQLQAQSGATTFTFFDNADSSIRHRYEQLNDLLEHYYDTPRVVPGRDARGETRPIHINQEHKDAETGETRNYDLKAKARLAVAIEVGPGYDALKDKESDFLNGLIQHLPPPFNVALVPKIIKTQNLGIEGEEMIDTITKLLPPALQPDNPAADLPPQVQQIVQQHGILTQQVHKLSEMIQNKVVEKQADNQAKLAQLDKQFEMEQFKASQAEKLARIQQETALIVAEAQHNFNFADLLTQAQLKRDLAYTDAAHEVGMEAVKHVHAVAQTQQQHDQSLEQGQVQHEQGMEQQGDQQDFQAEQSDADRQAAAQQASQSEGE